jgi:mannuronan 5-epimerase
VSAITPPAWNPMRHLTSLVFFALTAVQAVIAADPLPIVDTAYPIPGGAIYVSPSGVDTNPGTLAAPLRLLRTAVSRAASGATIVLRTGDYRESLTSLGGKRLTIQAYPHEQAWMTGSVPISGWAADGTAWRKDGWTYRFVRTIDPNYIDPAYPLAGYPDMVFVDGIPLRQVATRSEVVSWTFFVDYNASQLFIGNDPGGRNVEAAALGQALNIAEAGSAGSIIRGIGFRYYAVNGTTYGMVIGNAAQLVFENDTFAWSANMGISIFASDCVFRGNLVLSNGGTGLNCYRGNRLVIEGNRFAYNNQEHFATGWGTAGSKFLAGKDMIVRDNIAEDNLCKGLWADGSVYQATIVGNVCRRNSVDGLMFELSSKSIIASNLFYGNARCGLKMGAGSNHVRVYNNTFARNRNNYRINGDTRRNTNAAELALDITWKTGDVTFINNVLSENDGANAHNDNLDSAYFLVRDYAGGSSASMITAHDYNAYVRRDPAVPLDYVSWWNGTNWSYFRTIGAFTAATGLDAHSVVAEGSTSSGAFINENAADFRLRSDSPARRTGQPIPSDIAAAIGVTAGTTDMGALKWTGMPTASDVVFSAQPASQTVNPGQTATFSAVASGSGPLSYQWRRNGVAIVGATAASYTTPPATAADSGARFSLSASDATGVASSGDAVLTVTDTTPPALTTVRVVLEGIVNGTVTQLTVNGVTVVPDSTGRWTVWVTVPAGTTAVPITTKNRSSFRTRYITLTLPPGG